LQRFYRGRLRVKIKFIIIYEINKLLILASNKVSKESREEISEDDIIEVGYTKDIMEKEILNHYTEKKMLIDVKGTRIGQVNALSVIDTGYFSFGKPIKILVVATKVQVML